MSLRALRPVGERLPPLAAAPPVEALVPAGYQVVFTQSGTAALALALRCAAARDESGRRRVLLPAYGCPDLVAATVFTGLEPELVDTSPDSPFMSQSALRERLGDDVLAVVGAHFLGLAEDIAGLQAICAPHGVTVIEDSAQRIPGAGGIDPGGDLVVMSFGRGKPAGALGGGALLLRPDSIAGHAPAAWLAEPRSPRAPASLMRYAYNLALRPVAYGVVSRLPGLEVGATRYRPLEALRRLDAGLRRAAQAGWSGARLTPLELQARYMEMIESRADLTSLPVVREQGGRAPLTRFPVLVRDAERRETVLGRLATIGLGGSAMYGKALADLDGVPAVHFGGIEVARSFASRLVTLPLHADVCPEDLRRIAAVLATG